MLERSAYNPILKAHTDLDWCSKKVYNCAVIKKERKYIMVFRAVGEDWISRLGIAESDDGIAFVINPKPVMSPEKDWEAKGCEDPRIVKLNDSYYLTYTAFDGKTANAAIASSKDLHSWTNRTRLFPDLGREQREGLPTNWSKAAALFSKKINNKYLLMFGDNHIWAATSENLKDWQPMQKPVITCRKGYFDSAYVEMGPPPIYTNKGWLVLYHGIDSIDEHRTYSLGATLFDKDNPVDVIWRSSKPILKPTEPYEVIGMIDLVEGGFNTLKKFSWDNLQDLASHNKLPKAIFCCGAILEDKTVRLFYSGGDTVVCTATVELDTIFKS